MDLKPTRSIRRQSRQSWQSRARQAKTVVSCISRPPKGRSQPQPVNIGCAVAAAVLVQLLPAAADEQGFKGCEANTSCVSPAAWKSPGQYMPAWDFAPSSRDEAFRQALATVNGLAADGRAELLEQNTGQSYLKARLTFMLAGKADYDVAEIWLREDGIATFRLRCEVDLPSPPGCFRKNCINGPRTRQHATWLQDQLGWPSLETDEDKSWRPLFLH